MNTFTLRQLHEVSGVSESDIRLAFMATGADLSQTGAMTLASAGDTPICPSRACAVLLLHWMTRCGHSRDQALASISFLKGALTSLGEHLSAFDDKWDGPLWVVMVQDGRYLTIEAESYPAYDLNDALPLPQCDLPLPVVFQGLSLAGAYLRTLATTRCQPGLGAAAGSAGTAAPSES